MGAEVVSSWKERLARSEALFHQGLSDLAQSDEVKSLSGRRVCIAGCTGLIGSTLTDILAEANRTAPRSDAIQIYGIAREATPSLPTGVPDFHFVKGSVADPELTRGLPKFDDIIYVAGAASDYLNRVKQIVETQFVGLERFLFQLPEASRFVYVSSARVYGRLTGEDPVEEDRHATVPPMHLDNIYDSHKRFGESLCLLAARQNNRHTAIARISNVYGPHREIRSETAVTDFVRHIIDKRTITINGNNKSIRNHCSVVDIARGLFQVLVRGRTGRAYNIASNEHLTTAELAQKVSECFPFPVAISGGHPSAEVSILRLSIKRARSELDYQPRFTFDDHGPVSVLQTARRLGLAD